MAAWSSCFLSPSPSGSSEISRWPEQQMRAGYKSPLARTSASGNARSDCVSLQVQSSHFQNLPSLSGRQWPLGYFNPSVSTSSKRERLRTRAKRTDAPVKDVETEKQEELDEDMRVGLNEVANEAVRVMLSEDIQQVSAFKRKVDTLGEFLVGEGQLDAARFMFVVQGMLNHALPEEVNELRGIYKAAFEKMGGLLEDSGWLLALPGQEDGAAMEMVDEELIPPVLRTPY
eukprot:TRINITY_DN37005_c0_g1_i1.p1 TRINITY_DN37005_c0_g1~~TRINITY_DN37005_c0_g1_i1.p1  ORF type:complete len:230 (-),score=46.28 TRINITY_DN37005_c0_g1_i1:168-857(-)